MEGTIRYNQIKYEKSLNINKIITKRINTRKGNAVYEKSNIA